MNMRCKKARKNISLALDSRLEQAAMERLQAHLHDCASCRAWRKEQDVLLEMMKVPQAAVYPCADFYAVLRDKINESQKQATFFTLAPSSFRPALLRAAMLLIMIFSTLLGFFLGGRLETPAGNPADVVFSQTMNLEVFADLPAESFGAVYERLLQGELQ